MQSYRFSDEEALKIAMQIERKGAQFYKMAQGVCDDQNMVKLLKMLEDQELDHAAVFEKYLDEIDAKKDLEDIPYREEANAFLSAIAAEVVFPGGVMASMMNRNLDSVQDVLMHAIQSEKDSILFYQELILNTHMKGYIPTLERIIQEEKSHLFDLRRLLEEG